MSWKLSEDNILLESDCAKCCCQVKLGEEFQWSGGDEKLSAVGFKIDGRRETRDSEH